MRECLKQTAKKLTSRDLKFATIVAPKALAKPKTMPKALSCDKCDDSPPSTCLFIILSWKYRTAIMTKVRSAVVLNN